MENLVNGVINMSDLSFYKGKKVLVTGHTGFKGTWLCNILHLAGAQVIGYSLLPPTNPSMYELTDTDSFVTSIIGDIRDFDLLKSVFDKYQPEIVFHLAAQPIVLESYKCPKYTYETNVMGTVNVLECIRLSKCVKSFLNVTTDKIYKNNESADGFRENDPLDGFDPYSNSKSCSELVTHSYKNSFFADNSVAISTARAGNVIGGGDFADNRIIPDCVRAALAKKPVEIRNPNSVRPYQHVLEPLYVYLMIAQRQYEDIKYADYYNVGPNESDCLTTGELAKLFCSSWGEGQTYSFAQKEGPHEANFLRLDCSKVKSVFSWNPHWSASQAVQKTVEWTKVYADGGNISCKTDEQIKEFFNI
jgi:CDP-glucose 4,6-dehydratase